jgi:hypothetical protein
MPRWLFECCESPQPSVLQITPFDTCRRVLQVLEVIRVRPDDVSCGGLQLLDAVVVEERRVRAGDGYDLHIGNVHDHWSMPASWSVSEKWHAAR